jgi:dolichol-phosphate mannosyltransferase
VLISVVIPVFNECEVMPHLFAALPPVLDSIADSYEIIMVDDGSSDGTREWLRDAAVRDSRIKLISFSRNFGQQAAMTAGLDYARGDVVVVMDCDLQDPPEMLEKMLEKLHQGYDVVSCQRATRAGETFFKKTTATAFYQLMRRAIDKRIPPEVGDFRMYSRTAVQAIRSFREQHRFMRGLVAWLGLKEALIPFDRPPRVAGETKYPVSKLIRLAWTAISSSSAVPLKLCSYAGTGMLMLGVALSTLAALASLSLIPFASSGLFWAGLQLCLSGINLCAVGLLGDYVGRIYEESKHRPLYIVGETENIPAVQHKDRAVWLQQRTLSPAEQITAKDSPSTIPFPASPRQPNADPAASAPSPERVSVRRAA